MTTAFVLSGGANLGAVQVGMLRALHESNVRPDLPVGASVGVVTDVLDGRDVALSSGTTVEVITASAVIAGVFAPAVVDGRAYMDGGVVNNAPVSHAVELGADTVYVLATGYTCSLSAAPMSALARGRSPTGEPADQPARRPRKVVHRR